MKPSQAFLLAALLAAGCGSSSQEQVVEVTPEVETSAPAGSLSSRADAPAASSEVKPRRAISEPLQTDAEPATSQIPECAEMLAKYDLMIESVVACFSKDPTKRALMEPTIKALQDSRKQMAETFASAPATAASALAESCRASVAAMQPVPCP